MEHLNDWMSWRAGFVNLAKYENEFDTMRCVLELPEQMKQMLKHRALNWMNNLVPKAETIAQLSQKSTRLREQGNDLFRASPKTNALAASRLYTEAIFVAPLGSECLALAHANRAAALQEFGYFQQAYDDCECALELGYPEKLAHKLLMRQAVCAMKLDDQSGMKHHLDTLSAMKLNPSFTSQLEELTQKFQELQCETKTSHENEKKSLDPHRHTQKIMKSPSKGRYMVAEVPIKEHEVIFSECASSFLPIKNLGICQQCAISQLIPFPCYRCNGKVVYCSLKCRTAHKSTHDVECVAYQKNLFDHVGIAHFALRLMLDGLPEVVSFLAKKETASELWSELTNTNDSLLLREDNLPYVQTLNMSTHLGKRDLNEIVYFAMVSDFLVLYLREFTYFFKAFEDTLADQCDWELVIGSLILRHIGQLIVNAHTSIAMVCSQPKLLDRIDISLMADNLWDRPFHVRRGFFHQFGDYDEMAVLNLPYLSLCNHSCQPSLKSRFSGRCFSAIAAGQIRAGDEIFNSYTVDYRSSKRQLRRMELKETYNFDCCCTKCTKTNPDEDYESYHRYRCINPNCKQIFTPQLPDSENLNWWQQDKDLKCSKCGENQPCLWYDEFFLLLDDVNNPKTRQELYKLFDNLHTWLIDHNLLKLNFAIQLVENCFAAHNNGSLLSDCEFQQLGEILQFYLRGTASRNGQNSIPYVEKVTLLWDFIALGKYQCGQDEMEQMLQAIKIVSDEMKALFLNYFKDYIEPQLSVNKSN